MNVGALSLLQQRQGVSGTNGRNRIERFGSRHPALRLPSTDTLPSKPVVPRWSPCPGRTEMLTCKRRRPYPSEPIMTTLTALSASVTPEAATRIAKLGLQTTVDRMIDY